MIDVRNLEFRYPEGGFRLQVPRVRVDAGECVALTGPSGCGKTTLVNLLAGILEASHGSIEVAGFEVTSLDLQDRQDLRALKMGLVFQEFELLEYLDVMDNVVLPYRLTPLLECDDEVRARAQALVEDVGLGEMAGRFPGQLSQGERQRVALCRALVTQPAVILGDEPTGNLDPANRDHVIDALLRYGRENNAPVVVVTHDHEILPRFDRAVDVTELQAAPESPQIVQMNTNGEGGQ
ncbi:MAG: ABC transporter ATP-binding protein [Acidobacteria bacterium]|nr:ABC transporter ATP-binding protein [Acidobacteriota bacterium]